MNDRAMALLRARQAFLFLMDEEAPPRQTQAPFETCDGRGYFASTHYRVTEETFVHERDRLPNASYCEDRSAPPSGLVCSARLGQVEMLL
jgi:hypothetical protein